MTTPHTYLSHGPRSTMRVYLTRRGSHEAMCLAILTADPFQSRRDADAYAAVAQCDDVLRVLMRRSRDARGSGV